MLESFASLNPLGDRPCCDKHTHTDISAYSVFLHSLFSAELPLFLCQVCRNTAFLVHLAQDRKACTGFHLYMPCQPFSS